MVATNEKVQFDFNEDFGDSNYKSCFARSCVVNSQFHSKSLDVRQLQKFHKDVDKRTFNNGNNQVPEIMSLMVSTDFLKSKYKDSQVPQPPNHPPPSPPIEDTASSVSLSSRRLSCCSSSSGGTRTSSRRGSDLPVENLALQTQVDTLQWQLKQAQASRQMYRAVMQQVVGFLERAHRSLDLISERQRVVQRSRSEYHVAGAVTSSPTTSTCDYQQSNVSSTSGDGYSTFRDFTWRRPKRQQTAPDEVPPEKLSQEAFRLLRTAQSLLNTREPDLAHISSDLSPKDQEFLSQLAREFPSRPQRATSFSINPQLISPSDREIKISTAFNRKLSLQRTPLQEGRTALQEGRRDSLKKIERNLETEFSSIVTDDCSDSKRCSVTSIPSITNTNKKEKLFFEPEKAPSPKTGSVSSAEDESGFSSMNSFQEVGLPLITSTSSHDNESFFKNGDISVNSSDSNITQIDMLNESKLDKSKLDKSKLDKSKLDKSRLIWNRADLGLPITHRRWSSTPVEVAQHDPLKVLWV